MTDQPPTVEFFEDDENQLYVQVEGKTEAVFPLEETEAFIAGIREKSPDEAAKALMGLTLEMAFAQVETILDPLRKALSEQYDIRLPEDQVQQVLGEVYEFLPGYIHHHLQESDEE